MITFNNPEDSQRRQNVEPLSVEEIEELVSAIDTLLVSSSQMMTTELGKAKPVIEFSLQHLIDSYQNLLHLSSNVGGWEGLAKFQEIADKQK